MSGYLAQRQHYRHFHFFHKEKNVAINPLVQSRSLAPSACQRLKRDAQTAISSLARPHDCFLDVFQQILPKSRLSCATIQHDKGVVRPNPSTRRLTSRDRRILAGVQKSAHPQTYWQTPRALSKVIKEATPTTLPKTIVVRCFTRLRTHVKLSC